MAVEPALQALIDKDVLPGGKALVPGCGRGYAVQALAASGIETWGIDIAPTAIEEAEAWVHGTPGAHFECADFFGDFANSHKGRFQLGYDCTFLCAIPKAMRQSWAEAWHRVLAPGAELVTLIFPLGNESDYGPPFPLSFELVKSLLEPKGFELISAEDVPSEQLARGGMSGEVVARWKAPEVV